MSANDRIELLRKNIYGSKSYEFVSEEVERISGYYSGDSINIDFSVLIDLLKSYEVDAETIEELLLTDEEVEGI